MATPLEPHAIIQVTIEGECYGQVILNVLLYEYQDTIPVEDYRTHMDLMHTKFETPAGLIEDYLDCCAGAYTMKRIHYQPIWPERLTPVTKTLEDKVGTRAGVSMPPNVAAVITKLGDTANRRSRGSLHIAGISSNDQLGGFIIPDLFTACEALAEELYQPAVESLGGDTVPVLWNHVEDDEAIEVTNAVTKETVRVMRRRTVGLGI